MRLITRFSLIAVLLGLTACATVPQVATPIYDQSVATSITEKVSLGTMIALPPDGGVEADQARVVDEYFSASGRHCVRVNLTESGGSTRVICQRKGGNWSFTRSLFNDASPVKRDETLITIPLKGIESRPAELLENDQSSVADILGTSFDTHYANLPAFESNSAWNFAGTSAAGPARWIELALASLPELHELAGLIVIDEPITGRR